VNAWDLIPVLLLTLLSVALSGGAAIVLLVARQRRKIHCATGPLGVGASPGPAPDFTPPRTVFPRRPASWLAIRSRNLRAVQAALGLHHPKPCAWIEGLAGGQKLFIAPPVKGWILIIGSDVPDPNEDVDACFRFVLDLSRKLGQVQFFSANRVLGHHAWVRAEAGRIVRAYAWAGKTLWNQGIKTRAELELGVKCFHYFEAPERTLFSQADVIALNTEKVPLLAARWSLDPAGIDERLFEHAQGIAGEPSRHY